MSLLPLNANANVPRGNGPAALVGTPMVLAAPTPPDKLISPPAPPPRFAELLRQSRSDASSASAPAPAAAMAAPVPAPATTHDDDAGDGAAEAVPSVTTKPSSPGAAKARPTATAKAPSGESTTTDAERSRAAEQRESASDEPHTRAEAAASNAAARASDAPDPRVAAASGTFDTGAMPGRGLAGDRTDDAGEPDTGSGRGAAGAGHASAALDASRAREAAASADAADARAASAADPARDIVRSAGVETSFRAALAGTGDGAAPAARGASVEALATSVGAAVPAPIETAAAATDTTVLSLATPIDAPEFASALGLQVSVLAHDGVQRAELHLNPVEMGPVSIHISLDGTTARVDFGADAAATRQAIERGLPELAGALRDAGFTLAGGGVSSHAHGRDGSDGSDGNGDRPGARLGAARGPVRDERVTAAASGAATRALRQIARGGVDLYA